MDLELTEMWQNATYATGHLADAIKARRDNSRALVTKELSDAADLLAKALMQVRQELANSPDHRSR